jgi:uncharacterized protein (TIGR02996 family)
MPSIAAHLERALAKIDELAAARDELVAAWRIAPQERLARLVELVDDRRGVTDHAPARRIGEGHGTRARSSLAGIPPDPRIAPVLLELLAQPPWRSNPTLPFWRACCDRLVETRDPRILARLETVARGYPRTIPTTVGIKVSGYLNAALARLQHEIRRVTPLEPAALELCAEIEARLGFRSAKVSAGTVIADELLAAVYATPTDDAPRLVFADHLAQRGDPRGEFINLQLARAAGRADDATRARELALLAESGGQWVGRAGIAFAADHVVFRRGFPAYAKLPRTRTVLPSVVGDPAWSTLEVVDVRWNSTAGTSRSALHDIVDAARGLRAVLGVPATFLASLADIARLERIEGVAVSTNADRHVVEQWLADARAPRRLGIAGVPTMQARGSEYANAPDVAHVERLVDTPGFARLDTLVVDCPGEVARWLALIEPTPVRRLVLRLRSGLAIELTRDGDRFAHALFRFATTGDAAATFPNDAASSALRSCGRRLEVTIDARTPFYPGMAVRYARPSSPTDRLLDGIVDDLDAIP